MVATMEVSATTATASDLTPAVPVATASTKRTPPNIRTGTVQPPVLVSPISVAHSNAMLGVDGSKKGGANWMRDQWVANLKKKRMGAPGGPAGADAPVATASVGPVPTVKAGVRAETSRNTGEKTTTSRSKRSSKSKNAAAAAAANAAANVTPVNTMVDKDSLSLMHPALFFNDLGCFELESPSFMRLTPTTRDSLGSHSLLDAGILPSPAQASSALKMDKKWMKPLMKKRSNCFASDLNSEPKRRTPRRPNTSAGTFEDSDCSAASSPHSYTSVGTPSNFNSADVSRMWGPELDLPNGYVDTFLDLPTPKSAEMPIVTARTPSSLSRTHNSDDLEQPKLIRTTSIEQEGLSQFFEQTTLGGETELRQPSKTGKSYSVSTTAAAAHTVDEYFGKMAPSPAHYAFSNARCLQPTPKGTLRVHHASSDYSFDQPQKTTGSNPHASSSSEFDTLVQDYEFTDFDQELDSFYLDTIESFGGDLDLISN